MSEFVLQVQDIDENGKLFSFPLSQSWLETTLAEANLHADPAAPAGSVTVHAQKNGTQYLVEGRVQTSLTTECVRCLGAAKVLVDTKFATLFNRVAGAMTRDPTRDPTRDHGHRQVEETLDSRQLDEEDEDDLSREEFSGHEIALDDLVREYLVLESPMQPLCSADCQGIAMPANVRPPADVFGPSDGKVDPRLAPLLRLRDKVPPNKE
jgi:uncharacterized metal-binding protein YceD (DUF177 family)